MPADVDRTLRQRAARDGRSLQEYLRAHLIEEARRPTLEEVFERVEHRTGGRVGFAEAVDAQREEREAR